MYGATTAQALEPVREHLKDVAVMPAFVDDLTSVVKIGSVLEVVTAGLYFGLEDGRWGGAHRIYRDPRFRPKRGRHGRWSWQFHQAVVDREHVCDFFTGVINSGYPWSIRAGARTLCSSLVSRL